MWVTRDNLAKDAWNADDILSFALPFWSRLRWQRIDAFVFIGSIVSLRQVIATSVYWQVIDWLFCFQNIAYPSEKHWVPSDVTRLFLYRPLSTSVKINVHLMTCLHSKRTTAAQHLLAKEFGDHCKNFRAKKIARQVCFPFDPVWQDFSLKG